MTLREGHQATPGLRDDLRDHVTKKIGAIARPRALGDTTTLADPNVMGRLKDQYEKAEA